MPLVGGESVEGIGHRPDVTLHEGLAVGLQIGQSLLTNLQLPHLHFMFTPASSTREGVNTSQGIGARLAFSNSSASGGWFLEHSNIVPVLYL